MNFNKLEDDDENIITDVGNKKFKIINSNSGINCTIKKNDKEFYHFNNTYKLECLVDDDPTKTKNYEITKETKLIEKLNLTYNDCPTLIKINNENNDEYKAILSELKCSKSKFDQFLEKIKEKMSTKTEEEKFITKCLKNIDNIIQKLINSETVKTLGLINTGILATVAITTSVVALTGATIALPLSIPLITSIGLLILLSNSLFRHYNKYKQLKNVIYLIFTTALKFYNIFNIMIKIAKIYNFKLNTDAFINILNKLINQLLLLATPEVFNEIEKLVTTNKENYIFKLFINIKENKQETSKSNKIKNWFTTKLGFFSPEENLSNLGTLTSLLTQQFLIIFSEFFLVLKVKEYNYDNTNKNSFDCKHKEWINSTEYLELIKFSNIKETNTYETNTYETIIEKDDETYKRELIDVIQNLKKNNFQNIICELKQQIINFNIEDTIYNELFMSLVAEIKIQLDENLKRNILNEEKLMSIIISHIKQNFNKKTIDILLLLLKEIK
jgi:hypothetical protein